MGNIITPGADAKGFMRHAVEDSYSMDESLIRPVYGDKISQELSDNGQLFDYNELQPTEMFKERGMHFAALLHGTLSKLVRGIDYTSANPLPLFSVRVFEPGLHGTTIHRNDVSIGPWAIGITLKGNAPFNVYEQDQLAPGRTMELMGDDFDPEPYETMDTHAGSAWALYTEHEQLPHSSGIVNSATRRELLLLYGSHSYY